MATLCDVALTSEVTVQADTGPGKRVGGTRAWCLQEEAPYWRGAKGANGVGCRVQVMGGWGQSGRRPSAGVQCVGRCL